MMVYVRDRLNEKNIKYDLYAANFLYVFNCLNFIGYVLYQIFNIQPFFTILRGEIQPRTYNHFLITAPEELDRFISFFGEPSTFSFLMAISVLVFIKYRQNLKVLLSLIFMSISLSSTLLYIYLSISIVLLIKQKSKFKKGLIVFILIFFTLFTFWYK